MTDKNDWLLNAHLKEIKRERKVGGFDYELSHQTLPIMSFVYLPKMIEDGAMFKLDYLAKALNLR